MATKISGKVTHYYPKIQVAVIEVNSPLSVGDTIIFAGSNEYSQTIESMQVEHEAVSAAKKGEIVGLKVDQPVKPGDTFSKS